MTFTWVMLGITIFMAVCIPFAVATKRGFWHSTSRDYPAWAHAGWAAVPVLIWLLVAAIVPGIRSSAINYDMTARGPDLQALATSSELQGSFFLASGTVGEDQVFRYLTRQKDGLIQAREIEADYASVIEGSDDPHVEYRYTCYDMFPWQTCGQPALVFHVPEGSVLRDYDVRP